MNWTSSSLHILCYSLMFYHVSNILSLYFQVNNEDGLDARTTRFDLVADGIAREHSRSMVRKFQFLQASVKCFYISCNCYSA
jgi:hypothetical protein